MNFEIKTNQSRELAEIIYDEQGVFAIMDGHITDCDQIITFVRDYFQCIENIQQQIRACNKGLQQFDFIQLFANAHSNVTSHSHFASLMFGTTANLISAWGRSKNNFMSQIIGQINYYRIVLRSQTTSTGGKEKYRTLRGICQYLQIIEWLICRAIQSYIKGAKFPGLAIFGIIGDQLAESVGFSHVPGIFNYLFEISISIRQRGMI
ncbi:unnamed protein product (macronuclear) [Paramecium tetraurelia]|uniref:Uncharacterized protein n=1 Tax=Paramecium tetraurelia TaxID=5888 RepID=A0CKE7_PARTE|nr:uncharacterized protein GSPATT00000977001 [Paramecium tetraurelia]CAK71264.1 unnamed protein product [Paramecium tetraurelia]|eukprot:XP_001438661.1 hypothetical protein (macronuclear) [Paramecium tetraurelia strain d4-2]